MFTPDEFEAAILEAINGEPETNEMHCEPGCTTTGLLMARYGCTYYRADTVLKQLARDGKLHRAWVALTDGWGEKRRVKGYKLVME